MLYPRIFYHGTLAGGTDSRRVLCAEAETSFPIDCGLLQCAGSSSSVKAGQDALPIELPLRAVRAMVAMHVHIDHVRRIPYLLVARFRGLCSEPSATLLLLVLDDAFKLGISRSQKELEQYMALAQRIIAAPYNHRFTLSDTAKLICGVRLQCAGHILRSAYVEVDLAYPKTEGGKRVLFSGALCAPPAPLLPAPTTYGADTLGVENIYGARQRENRLTQRQRLKYVINQMLEHNGTVLIPAFSIGRTQELRYKKNNRRARTAPAVEGTRGSDVSTNASELETSSPELPIIFNSPLASRFAAAYPQLQSFWNQEAPSCVNFGRRPLGFERLITANSHSDSMRMVQHLARTARPTMVIAGNGSCSSGRIVSESQGR